MPSKLFETDTIKYLPVWLYDKYFLGCFDICYALKEYSIMKSITGKIIEITKPHRLTLIVNFSFLNLTKCAKPTIVTIRFNDKNTKTEIENKPNIDTDVEGGMEALMFSWNNIVVISIEVFKPIRKPTDPGSLRLNKKETTDTKQKTNGGKRLAKALDGLIFAWVIIISA